MADVTLKTARGPHIKQSEVKDLIDDMAAKLAIEDGYTRTQITDILAEYSTTSAITVLLDDYATSSAVTTALADKIGTDQLGATNGVATLSGGTIPLVQIPDGVGGGEKVGMSFTWNGIDLPDGGKHLWEDGSTVSRETYPDLLAALTTVRVGDLTDASAVVSGLDSTTRLRPGYKVEGTGVPAGATISSVDSGTQITLSANATATGSDVDLRFFAWGNGDGSTTFNLPDKREVVELGRGDMGGTDRNTLGLTDAQGNIDSLTVGAEGGEPAFNYSVRVQGNTSGDTDMIASLTSEVTNTSISRNRSLLQPSVIVNKVIRALP